MKHRNRYEEEADEINPFTAPQFSKYDDLSLLDVYEPDYEKMIYNIDGEDLVKYFTDEEWEKFSGIPATRVKIIREAHGIDGLYRLYENLTNQERKELHKVFCTQVLPEIGG